MLLLYSGICWRLDLSLACCYSILGRRRPIRAKIAGTAYARSTTGTYNIYCYNDKKE